MKWFRHDSAAHRDAKLKKLKHKHGIVGYGLYWYCLELIAGNVDKNNITFELEDDAELVALEWNLDRVTVSEIMGYMVEIDLFESNDNRITCLKMAHRLDDTNSRNPEIQSMLKLRREKNALSLRKSPENPEAASDRLDKTRTEEKRTDQNSGTDPIRIETSLGEGPEIDTFTGEVLF